MERGPWTPRVVWGHTGRGTTRDLPAHRRLTPLRGFYSTELSWGTLALPCPALWPVCLRFHSDSCFYKEAHCCLWPVRSPRQETPEARSTGFVCRQTRAPRPGCNSHELGETQLSSVFSYIQWGDMNTKPSEVLQGDETRPEDAEHGTWCSVKAQ